MVTIDKNKCIGCGQCKKICHRQCIDIIGENNQKSPQIDQDYCSLCSQCVAICPQQALSWNGNTPQEYNPHLLPSDSQIEELLKERRTVRKFRKLNISDATLREIGSIGGYAPTNHENLRCIILNDLETIHQLDVIMLQQLNKLNKYIYQSNFTFHIFQYLSPHVNPIMRRKIQWGLKQGTMFESDPAALFFIVGTRNRLLSSESAQFAAYNMMLFAQTKHLGTRYLAAGKTTLSSHRKARALIELKKSEQILSAFELGFPAVHFRNKIIGKEMPVTFPRRKLYEIP